MIFTLIFCVIPSCDIKSVETAFQSLRQRLIKIVSKYSVKSKENISLE